MKNLSILVACLIGMLLFLPLQTYAETTFECYFIQEKHKGGKSNQASCSMNPEVIFSSSMSAHSPTEHCDVDDAYICWDYLDFKVTDHWVGWDDKMSFSAEAKISAKKDYIKEGKSEEEAEKLASRTRTTKYMYVVLNHLTQTSEFRFSVSTNQYYKEPKKQIVQLYSFGDEDSLYTLYIPMLSRKAILIRYISDEDISWIRIRFGKCREMKK